LRFALGVQLVLPTTVIYLDPGFDMFFGMDLGVCALIHLVLYGITEWAIFPWPLP
jgi:predicted ABC-type sugar transport system permease subunit